MSSAARRRAVEAVIDSQPGATEDFPFGPDVAVWKVGGKMFAVLPVEAERATLQLKVEPERGALLRDEWPSIQLPYHLNKQHWIQVVLDGSVPKKLLSELIEDSWDLVVAGLPASVRAELRRER